MATGHSGPFCKVDALNNSIINVGDKYLLWVIQCIILSKRGCIPLATNSLWHFKLSITFSKGYGLLFLHARLI